MNIVNRLTLRHLRLNRGRTIITIFGIVLSVAMVCCVAGFAMSMHDLLMREIKERKGDYHVSYVSVAPDIADQIAQEDIFSTSYTVDPDPDGKTNIYLRLKQPGRDVLDVADSVANKYNIENWGLNIELLNLEGTFPHDNVMRTFSVIAAIAIIIIVVGSIIVIANAFNISASERVRQFGLLKSAGATSGQLGRSILFEAFILAIIAIPIGIMLGFLIQAAVLWLTNGLLSEFSAMNLNDVAFHVVFDPLIVWVSIAIAMITVLISAWFPARRAAKTSPIDAIRQAKDIQIRAKQIKTSRLTQILFGFEGTLAAKSLKRNRGKYRAAVVSLTVSIVLFLSVSSFVWVMNTSAGMLYGGYDLDVLINTGGDLAWLDEMEEILTSIPDSDVNMVLRTCVETIVPDGFLTEHAQNELTDQDKYGILIFSMPDAEFAQMVNESHGKTDGIFSIPDAEFGQIATESQGNKDGIFSIPDAELAQIATESHDKTDGIISVPDAEFGQSASASQGNKDGVFSIPDVESAQIVNESQGKTDGILINTTGSFRKESKLRDYIPYNCRIGTEFPLSGRDREGELACFGTITVAATIDKIPNNMIAPLFEGNYINVIVSQTAFSKIYQADRSFAYFSILTSDPDAFCETATALLQPFSEGYTMTNVSQITRLYRNITLIFKLFGYGFIAMLSLIAVTSVISTISTGMALRRQEFAMLYSAGMTPGGMRKMLDLESLLYGLRSIILGTPTGLALSYLIYLAMGATADFAFQVPWSAMAISAAAVMLLTFGTMRYGKRKLSRISIVEAIRNEAI